MVVAQTNAVLELAALTLREPVEFVDSLLEVHVDLLLGFLGELFCLDVAQQVRLELLRDADVEKHYAFLQHLILLLGRIFRLES